jgi:glycyl-tRNA synthetase
VTDTEVQLDTIVNLAKRRGFIFPGSEIYGGLANSWDYGPLGTLLKNNVRDAWWRYFVTDRDDIVPLDAAILMNPKVWEASGHVANFNDPMVEDKVTHKRYRADHLLEGALGQPLEGMTVEEMAAAIKKHQIKSPDGHELSEPKVFNLLFETSLGSVEGKKQTIYLRGELAQAMFVDFKYIMETMRKTVPFGIAQVGKVFRNEITPGNFTFRTLEFDLMEFEYFVREPDWQRWFQYWLEQMQRWLRSLGIDQSLLRVREHSTDELAHYSKKTVDIEYHTPFGWKELLGLAYRTDYDLRNHAETSGQELQATDAETGEKFFPHVIEPTFGLTRLVLIVLLSAYHQEQVRGQQRVVLRFPPYLAPYQVAVLPLSNKDELVKVARPIAEKLRHRYSCDLDVTQSIGRRYRRQDEIGTPYCITVDFDTLKDKQVTVRARDTMDQDRVDVDRVDQYIEQKLARQ